MTIEEFSNTLDTYLNSYGSEPNITLDEYEKSVFLTQAQEQIVTELYTGRTALGTSFEDTEECRAYLRNLIETAECTPVVRDKEPLSKNSKFFHLPDDLLFITYESAILGDDAGCRSGAYITVVPTTQDDYSRVSKNPFKRAGSTRALRLDLGNGDVEIVSKYDLSKYIVRYLRRPKPIVLANTEVEGFTEVSECELEPMIHRPIAERAALLALQSRASNAK